MTETASPFRIRLPQFSPGEVRLPVLGFSLSYAPAAPGAAPTTQCKRRDYHLLGWTAGGAQTALLGPSRLALPAGRAVVLPPGIATGFAVPAACERYALKVSGAAVEAVLEGLGINCGVVYAAGPPPGELFRRLYRAMNDPSPAGLIEASSCTYELFALLARRRRRARTDPVVRRALSILETAWADAGLNAAVLADRTGVHRSVLTEGFRKAFGIGPATYLRRLRVRRALALLEEGSRPVQEVAAACGVPGASQFSRLIRRATGLSPRRIREGA